MKSGEKRLGAWVFDACILFGLTALLIWPKFRTEYLDNWSSIDSTFIADSLFLRNHWPHPGWQPNWYCGTRFDYIYPPLLRYGTAGISLLFNISTARGYHLYTAIFYCLGIVGVYIFMRAGSGSRTWAWVVALTSTLVSPVFIFLEHIRKDNAAVHHMPMRLGVLVRYGEGPHMSAFALLPFALTASWYGLRKGRPGWLAASSVFCALVVSNNFYGATALALLFPILAWAVWLAERDWLVWIRAAAVAALAYGLTAFWLTPSYLTVTLRNMQLVSQPGNAWSLWLDLAVLGLFGVISWRFAAGKPQRAWPVFVIGALVQISLNVLGNAWFNFRILGEPERLIPEFDLTFLMAFALLAAYLWPKGRFAKVAITSILIVAACSSVPWVRYSRHLIPRARPDEVRDRLEYRMTNWIHEHLPGQRVMATGSLRFWYNAWFEMPQMGGGSEQGSLNLLPNWAYFQVAAGDQTDIAIAWLQAMGVDAVAVHDDKSREIFHDYAAPHRFAGVLESVYADGEGNWIYRIPRRYPGLARVVDGARMAKLHSPRSDYDFEMVQPYADAVERGPERAVQWQRLGTDSIWVRADLRPGERLLVQESHDPAWRARSGGREIAIERDAMGFMLLDLGPGDHDITLEFTTPLENIVGRAITAIALAAAGLLFRRALL